MDIDLVYLWVDGNDPVWLARKNTFLGNESFARQSNCKGRFANNDELKFSLRSVEKFIPWVRRIFIITDNQIPDWLKIEHPKISIVDHRQILPEEALPCYNSEIIEYFIYKIPDLSEHFIYLNDDMFFNDLLKPDFFFAADGFPIVRLKRKTFGLWNYRLHKLLKGNISDYKQSLVNASKWFKKNFDKQYSAGPHHNADAYLKSDFQIVSEHILRDNPSFITHHIRNSKDIQRVVFSYFALLTGRGYVRYAGRNETCMVRLERKNYRRYFDKYSPKLVCMEDGERASDSDRKRAKAFMENHFPCKSSFEK
jgi:hypothetical protein